MPARVRAASFAGPKGAEPEVAVRVVMLGLSCAESMAAVLAVREAGVTIASVIVAETGEEPAAELRGRRRDGNSSAAPALAGLSEVIGVRSRPEAVAAIDQARPDVIITACFPWRLPPAVLVLPPLGCLNLHPSLLPRGRGPDPVFWTYRRDERQTGVTVHLMDDGLDTGPMLAQHRIEVPLGSRAPALEQSLMAEGGRLAAALLPRLARGELRPMPQDEALATTAPAPGPDDFVMPTSWPPDRAYRFAAGVAPLAAPLAVQVEATGARLPVRDALDFAPVESMPEDIIDEGRGIVRVRFGQGWVRFLRADAGRYQLSLSPISARDIR